VVPQQGISWKKASPDLDSGLRGCREG